MRSSRLDDWELAARGALRRVMIQNQSERDTLALALLHNDSPGARAMADILDMASLHSDVRRRISRLLGELEGEES